jgi:t-SNARE complex subunit (syntaxin)
LDWQAAALASAARHKRLKLTGIALLSILVVVLSVLFVLS